MSVEEGKKAPDFTAADRRRQEAETVGPARQAGGALLLSQGRHVGLHRRGLRLSRFRCPTFKKLKAQVIGVSKDSVEKHDKFKAKYGLTFPLVSDEDGKICEKYGTWVEKSLYGRKYMGIERATFLIDKTGAVAKVWHKVKVPGHVDEVLQAVKAL